MQNNMWKIWKQFSNLRSVIIGTVGSLFALAFFIHIVLFASPQFNWLQGSHTLPAAAAQMTPLPKLR